VIDESIAGGEIRIHGAFSPQETADLTVILRSGSLPASLDYLEERTIGPSLGAGTHRDLDGVRPRFFDDSRHACRVADRTRVPISVRLRIDSRLRHHAVL